MNTVSKKALIIDANPIAVRFLAQAIEALGFEVEMQSQLDAEPDTWIPDTAYDLILLDTAHQKNEISVQEFIEKIDSVPANHDTRFIITSADMRNAEVKRTFDAAEVKSIPKPIDLPSFMRSVNELMEWPSGQRVFHRAPAIIVEDVNTTALIVQKLLDVLGVHSFICNTAEEFNTHIEVIHPEIISLDLYLPDGNGLEICKSIRATRNLDELPIVIVSGNSEMDTVVECLRIGANDHISKPIIKEEFFARVSNVLKIRKLQKELHAQQKQMETLAFTDPLTTLFNRTYMDMALQREMERTRRSNAPLGLLLIDLDFFKKVNDSYGHEVGDEVLREFSALLKRKIRSYDVPCRFGGEEFCVLLPGSTASNVVTVAERIRKACEERTFSSKEIHQTISIGTSVFPELSREHSLVSDADKALYSAKQGGRNRTIVSIPM